MRQLDDGYRMIAILVQCVFECLVAVHEEAAKMPFCSQAIHLPKRFLPTRMVGAAGLHEGGASSFRSSSF